MKQLTTFLLLATAILACDKSDLFIEPNEDMSVALTETSEASSIDQVFMVVEEPPTYPGGNEAWYKHLKTTLKYPEQAKRQGIEGAVFLSFVVDKSGELRDMQVVRGIGAGCDEEALRVLLESEKWNPGKQRGIEVNARLQIRIVFSLDGTPQMPTSPQKIKVDTNPINEYDKENQVYSVPEKVAFYEGGQESWQSYLNKNLNYPEKARTMGIEGQVYLTFVVDKQGKPTNIMVARGIGAGCDEEAVRLLQNTQWVPGENSGEVVNSRLQIRIPFKTTTP